MKPEERFFLPRKSEDSLTAQLELKKKAFLCDLCEKMFNKGNFLKNHMEEMHESKESFENIQQLDGHASLPLDNSTNIYGLETQEIQFMDLLRKNIILHTSQQL